MELSAVIAKILNPGLALLPLSMDTRKARAWLLTIGLQESRFEHRYQVLNDPKLKGPARGFWQFERGGGVKGVMTHPKTAGILHNICADRGMAFDAMSVWQALETDDVLACVCARLLLFSDPYPLPEIGAYDAGWELYAERTWRPGKPHRSTWNDYHDQARAALELQ